MSWNDTWNNSITLISNKNPLTSTSMNTILSAIIANVTLVYNKVVDMVTKYSYGDAYLQDIIDSVVAANAVPLASTSTIATTEQRVTEILNTYTAARARGQKIRATYAYTTTPVTRVRYRGGNLISTFEETNPSVISSITIERLSAGGSVEGTLSTITFTRSLTPVYYSTPYLADYTGSSPADDLLSDYKYYQYYPIIGWTVA